MDLWLPLSPALSPLVPRGEREPDRAVAIGNACDVNCCPKGHATLSRYSSVKPPALPEVADSRGLKRVDIYSEG